MSPSQIDHEDPPLASSRPGKHRRAKSPEPSADQIRRSKSASGQRQRDPSVVLRSDDDERGGDASGRVHSKPVDPAQRSNRRLRHDRKQETRQENDDRHRSRERKSDARGEPQHHHGRHKDSSGRKLSPRRHRNNGGSGKLYEKAVEDRLQTYKDIEERVSMYKPPVATAQRHPPQRSKDKDWSLTSEFTDEYTSSSCSSEEEAKPPPPSKVYLLKGTAKHRAVDAESHITIDSEVADYQKTLSASSPTSTNYRRYIDPDIRLPSPKHRTHLNQWYHSNKRKPLVKTLSTHLSTSDDDVHTLQTASSDDGALLGADIPNITKSPKNPFRTKQSIAFMAIALTVVQLLVLMLQIALCGAATWDINPMFGPYPDAFSEWGGKNPYLMLNDNEWWRLITPSFLHVGFLHLLANAFCQLEAIALFEREWGSFKWILVYVISAVGCNAFSSLFDENSIAVGSSGSLMGLYAAKLAQVCSAVFFDASIGSIGDDTIRLDQMSSVLCGLTIVSLLSSFTYIDWSGHMGGFMAGFLTGMVLFSYTIRRCCTWFMWSALGFLGLVAGLTATIYFFITTTHPYEELADPCEYFRSLFPEGYVCGCMWQ